MIPLFLMFSLAQAGDLTALDAEPITTRAGHPRFVTPELRGTGAEVDALARLAAGQDAPEVRMALVEWLPRLGGEWAPGLLVQLEVESDAEVRRVIADVAARAPAAEGAAMVRLAASDPQPPVRRAAQRAALALEADLDEVITEGLLDEDAGVRAEAARSASALELPVFSRLVALLADADAEVRLQALRGLERLDAERARALPAARALVTDPEPRVARTAARVAGER